MEYKKGNVVFVASLAVDLFYVVVQDLGETVAAVKLDAPRKQVEKLPKKRVVKLAEEQEKLLPQDVLGAIEKQRMVVLNAPKKKTISLKKMFDNLPNKAIEEILQALGEVGGDRYE